MTQDVSNLSGVAVLGPRTDSISVSALQAVVVLGAPVTPAGTARPDLLSLVARLGVSSITQTGVTNQAGPDRLAHELTTGEQTVVTQITVVWSSPPTTEQLTAFARSWLGSPAFEVEHT